MSQNKIDSIFHFASQNDQLYAKHMELIRKERDVSHWQRHIAMTIIPDYQAKIENIQLSDKQTLDLANRLKEHFETRSREW